MKKIVLKTAMAAMAVLLSAGLGSNTAEAAKKAKISRSKLVLKVGQSKTLSVKNLSKKSKKKLKWSSNKKKIATVSKKGKVTARKAGTAKITAKAGKKKYTCNVTVKKKGSAGTADKDKKPVKSKEQLAAEDRANLAALVKKQRDAGAVISDNLEDGYHYGWSEDGRLTYLNLSEDEGTDFKLSGMIDVTPFTALETLKIDYNGRVTGVKTTGITTLKRLTLDDTAVSSINVSTNVNLETLYLSRTKITSLDVSKNKKLDSLWCNETKIKKLDISKNTMLQRLGCYGCGLTSLDLSKNPALTYLSCKDNKLTSLDLSALGKTAKVTVRCDDNVAIKGKNTNISVNEDEY